MPRAARGPILLLLGAGLLLFVVGAAGAFVGLALGERIHALLPPITADADAIGGAAMALGGASLLLGSIHVGMAAALRRYGDSDAVLVTGVSLCAVMAAIALGWAVAALVSGVSGSAPAVAMLPAGIGLGLLAAAYAWAAGVLLARRRGLRGRI